jgi:hypothetical protein
MQIFILCGLGLILRGSGIGAFDGKKTYARCGWGEDLNGNVCYLWSS